VLSAGRHEPNIGATLSGGIVWEYIETSWIALKYIQHGRPSLATKTVSPSIFSLRKNIWQLCKISSVLAAAAGVVLRAVASMRQTRISATSNDLLLRFFDFTLSIFYCHVPYFVFLIFEVAAALARAPPLLPLPLRLPKPHAGAAVIFGQEFDARLFEGAIDCVDRWFRHYAAAPFKIHNR
jgi:hypothetical protein